MALAEIELEVLDPLQLPQALAERREVLEQTAPAKAELEALEALQLRYAFAERSEIAQLRAESESHLCGFQPRALR